MSGLEDLDGDAVMAAAELGGRTVLEDEQSCEVRYLGLDIPALTKVYGLDGRFGLGGGNTPT